MFNAILFGSISTLVDTSELQRESFNDAFEKHGLDWHWTREVYKPLLAKSGGRDRIAAYAEERHEDVDAAAIHATKTEIFQEKMRRGGLDLRPGVRDVMRQAWDHGMQCGLVSTTARDSLVSALAGTGHAIAISDFDVIVSAEDLEERKPDPAPYRMALSKLGLSPDQAIAIEDNPDGFASARAADLACVAFPNANTRDGDYEGAYARTDDTLDFGFFRTAEAAE
ncbi:MAG: HAD family hydrolase [Shimia sp.]